MSRGFLGQAPSPIAAAMAPVGHALPRNRCKAQGPAAIHRQAAAGLRAAVLVVPDERPPNFDGLQKRRPIYGMPAARPRRPHRGRRGAAHLLQLGSAPARPARAPKPPAAAEPAARDGRDPAPFAALRDGRRPALALAELADIVAEFFDVREILVQPEQGGADVELPLDGRHKG